MIGLKSTIGKINMSKIRNGIDLNKLTIKDKKLYTGAFGVRPSFAVE